MFLPATRYLSRNDLLLLITFLRVRSQTPSSLLALKLPVTFDDLPALVPLPFLPFFLSVRVPTPLLVTCLCFLTRYSLEGVSECFPSITQVCGQFHLLEVSGLVPPPIHPSIDSFVIPASVVHTFPHISLSLLVFWFRKVICDWEGKGAPHFLFLGRESRMLMVLPLDRVLPQWNRTTSKLKTLWFIVLFSLHLNHSKFALLLVFGRISPSLPEFGVENGLWKWHSVCVLQSRDLFLNLFFSWPCLS